MAVMKFTTEVIKVGQQKIDFVGWGLTVDYGSKSFGIHSLGDNVPAVKSFLAYLTCK